MQVFAGSKQKQLEVGSMALMSGYTPIASVMLAILVPLLEPMGFTNPAPDTLLGFPYTPQAGPNHHTSMCPPTGLVYPDLPTQFMSA